MASLKYYDGAKPGKKRKNTSEERAEMKKRYENNRTERKFNEKWKQGREWLVYDTEKGNMRCAECGDYYSEKIITEKNLSNTNTFILGCKNFRVSSLDDHEKSKSHQKAHIYVQNKSKTAVEKIQSVAGRALKKLKQAERDRLMILFKNAHAIAKNNRPLTDYMWLCDIDRAKNIDIGSTYTNEKAAGDFIHSIAETERMKTVNLTEKNPFFSFMMDGSTDVSGDEQETMYIRSALKGVVTERFLNMSTPNSTRSQDLLEHVTSVLQKNNIDKSRLIAMGSDGASNMTGVRSGLSTLLKEHVSPEIINIHCFCHRLELAFRDVVKKSKLYDKLMTLLIGLYYFYKKSYKNKQGLKTSIEAMKKGIFPTKVTGTRWLPHLYRGMFAFTKTYNALEAHLSTASHGNAKGEGLLKLMCDKQLMAFVLFLQDALEPAIRLSLKLQRPEGTLSDSLCWVESTIELLSEKKGKSCEALNRLLESGKFEGIALKGATPAMKYTDAILEGFCDAIKQRFQIESKNVINATKILQFGSWPMPGSSEMKEYGNEELKLVCQHFQKSLSRVIPDISTNSVVSEWNLLKKLVTKKYYNILVLKWSTVFREITDVNQIMLLIDLMLTIPSTSVSCETAFSQLKLLKTCRRSRLGPSLLNDLMTVKLESPEIVEFNPDDAIDNWLSGSVMGRRMTYRRQEKKGTSESQQSVVIQYDSDTEDVQQISGSQESQISQESHDTDSDQGVTEPATLEEGISVPQEEIHEVTESYMPLERDINILCDKDSDPDIEEECFDFQDELLNFDKLMAFSRE